MASAFEYTGAHRGDITRCAPVYNGHEYSLKERPYAFVEFLFRKTAHLLIYAVLAVLIYGSLRYKQVRFITCITLALMFVAVIASIDEYIQQFSPNRTSSIWDVGVDLIGGSCGIAVYTEFELCWVEDNIDFPGNAVCSPAIASTCLQTIIHMG